MKKILKKKEMSRSSTGLERRLRAALPFLFQPVQAHPAAWEWIAKQSQWRVVATVDAQNRSCPRLRFEIICLKTHQRVHAWSQNIMLHGTFEPRVARTAGWLIALAQQRLRCPRCRTQLELVTRYDGQQFFGCPNWPACRASFSISDEWYIASVGHPPALRERSKMSKGSTQKPYALSNHSLEQEDVSLSTKQYACAATTSAAETGTNAAKVTPTAQNDETPLGATHACTPQNFNSHKDLNILRFGSSTAQQDPLEDPSAHNVNDPENDLGAAADTLKNKDEVLKDEKDPFRFLY